MFLSLLSFYFIPLHSGARTGLKHEKPPARNLIFGQTDIIQKQVLYVNPPTRNRWYLTRFLNLLKIENMNLRSFKF